MQAQQVAQRMYGAALPAVTAQQAAAVQSAFQAYARGAPSTQAGATAVSTGAQASSAKRKPTPAAKGGKGSKKRGRGIPTAAQLAADESKSLRRKQANRESARRSKLRKKEEYENLAQEAARLAEEGISLRTELARMQGVQDTLTKQNQDLRQEVLKVFGTLDGVPGLTKLGSEKVEQLKPDSGQPGLRTVSGSNSDASAGRNDVSSAALPAQAAAKAAAAGGAVERKAPERKGKGKGKSAGSAKK